MAAKEMQIERFAGKGISRNSELGPGLIEELCQETEEARERIGEARGRLKLSTRRLDILRKVARTCADLRERGEVELEDVERAEGFLEVSLPRGAYSSSSYVESHEGPIRCTLLTSRVIHEEQDADFSGNVNQSVGLVETAQNVRVLAAKGNTEAVGAPDCAGSVQASHSGGTAPMGHNNAAIETAAGELAAAEQWLEYINTALAPATYEGYAKVIRRFARSIDPAPSELTAEDIMDYLRGHQQRGVSQHTTNTWLIIIRSFLGWAEQRGLVDTLIRQQLPNSITYKPGRPVAATEEEVDVLLQEGGLPAPYRLAVLLMFDVGLRVSEVVGLRWADVDLTNCTINVLGKGQKRRLLPVASHRLYQALVAAGQGVSNPSWPVVWISHAGKQREEPLTPTSIRERLNQACPAAGLSHTLTPHCFRHGFAARAARAGINSKFIQQALGHSSLDVTDCYLDSLEGDIDSLREALSQI